MWSGSLQAEFFSLWKGLTIILLRALTDWIRLAHIMMDNLFYSVQFSLSVESHSLWPHESQLTRPPCPSPIPGVHPNSCVSSRWCHPAISSRRPLLLLPPIPPSIRVFANESTLCMRWPKDWTFNLSISPSNEHPGLISFRMDWLNLLAVQGTLKIFSNTTAQKHQFFGAQLSSQSNSHIHTWPLEKP